MTESEGESTLGAEDRAAGVDLARVFDQAPAPLLLLTPELVVVRANRARLELTGTTLEDTIGRHLSDALPVPDGPAAQAQRLEASLALARETRRPGTMPVQRCDLPLPDGTFAERCWRPRAVPVLDERGEVVLLLHRWDDVTDHVRDRERLEEVESELLARDSELQDLDRQLQLARDELALRALHDPSTGLLVRPALLEQLTAALARLQRRPGEVAVLLVDLDGLKQVNDSHGHAAGDALVRCCAQRLQDAVRPSDTVARIGGDEFVVLLDQLDPGEGVAAARAVAARLLRSLDETCAVAPGVLVHASASIGIATAAGTGGASAGSRADELLSRADAAAHEAKRGGRGRCRVFDETAHRRLSQRQRLAADLRAALAEGRLRLHYQPIIDLRTGATEAVEALLRWAHPDGRLRAAGEFIDVAEQAGLLPDIGTWVVGQACRQVAAWDAALGARAPQRMFLNLSPAELTQPRLHQHLADSARDAGIAPQRLVLEVTETGMVDASGSALAFQALQRLGCQLAIDDFGTGYSSLSRLVQLPASVLKVDRSFLRDLHRDQQSVAVIAAVLTLAHNLRKTVIAEGVEDAASLATLQDLGCSYAQGYHLAVPQPPDQLAVLLGGASAAPGG